MYKWPNCDTTKTNFINITSQKYFVRPISLLTLVFGRMWVLKIPQNVPRIQPSRSPRSHRWPNFYLLHINSLCQNVLGPCKPKSESWIPSISSLNPESLSVWKMNLRKSGLKFESQKYEKFWILNLAQCKIRILNLAVLKLESRIRGPFEIWIQNPWTPLTGPLYLLLIKQNSARCGIIVNFEVLIYPHLVA